MTREKKEGVVLRREGKGREGKSMRARHGKDSEMKEVDIHFEKRATLCGWKEGRNYTCIPDGGIWCPHACAIIDGDDGRQHASDCKAKGR